MKKRKPDKEHVARTPQAVAKYKELFLKQLALGRSPGGAARVVKIARATAYAWKNQDPEFDAAWVDAVETGLDLLERGLKEGGEDARFILKHRRYNIKSPEEVRIKSPEEVISDFFLNVPLEEHYKRLERLGLHPVIEKDYEEEAAPAGKTD